ncbi:quaternary ammonium compound-resistance protein SugE [Actinopolyspora xinjiangensis]|uniref:Quaternary ammonium compound-resistance protein SugE n=1 Tax=Actinopolyspora xinjiangensis TaxID=405564 RepID=A0A1H0V6P9_9ACTN|nr:multidrug efflux SMR transporter [Actinopolyspora xinjiangensis]SDP73858.1 quaternary ammonium compound-resistance protein SugE [Actinopolyspora xinjiangensis]
MTTSATHSETAPASTPERDARPWIVLLTAGLFEIGYAVSTGGSEGFTELSWSISAGVFFLLTVFTLTLALKSIDVGIGYAIWTGIGSSGAAVVSSFVLDETLTTTRVMWLALIIAGVVWIKLASSPKLAESSETARTRT